MSVADKFKQRITRLLTAPKDELGSWARILRSQLCLWRFCGGRLRSNNAGAMSAALSFRTIFAMVPAIVLTFLVLKSLGVVEDNKHLLRAFLDKSGLSQITYAGQSASAPASAPAGSGDQDPPKVSVAEWIESLVEGVEARLTVGRLGPVGVVLLIWAALSLLTTVERCLNRIFEARRSRSPVRRVLLYWSAMTLGPLALLAAAYAGARAVEIFGDTPVLSWTIRPIGWAGPIVVGVLLLACLYKLMPNTHVRFRTAAAGAVVAVPVWLVVRWAFSLYVQNVGKLGIYGAMGLVPLFLLWLNLSWLIFLFGAELAHAAANVSRASWSQGAGPGPSGPWELLAAAVAVARGQRDRGGPVSAQQVSTKLDLPMPVAADLLRALSGEGVLCRVADDDAYVLARPADRIPVADVLRVAASCGIGRHCAPEVADAVTLVRDRVEQGVDGLTVADIMTDE